MTAPLLLGQDDIVRLDPESVNWTDPALPHCSVRARAVAA